VNEVRELVKQEMEHVVELKVPVVADIGIGANWRDL
jgi:DNA polymerase-1